MIAEKYTHIFKSKNLMGILGANKQKSNTMKGNYEQLCYGETTVMD